MSDVDEYIEPITSDGQIYMALEIGINQIQKVLNGERAITIITQKGDEEE